MAVLITAEAVNTAGSGMLMVVVWLQPSASVTVNDCVPAGRRRLPVPVYGVAPTDPVTDTVPLPPVQATAPMMEADATTQGGVNV